MLVACNSCQKKFIVPDSAITVTGRLVQCGSCGNKWTQYPVKEEKSKSVIKKVTIKKTRPKKNLYTPEYLQKKHGLLINSSNKKEDTSTPGKTRRKSNFGFYSYVIILFVFLGSMFGIVNLTKEIIILKYPFAEIYISYLYEVIDIIKITIVEFIN